MTKVIIGYDTPDGEHVTKVWRFDVSAVKHYRLAQIRSDVLEFFPPISQRRLGVSLSYSDSQAGTITLESDADLQVSTMQLCAGVHAWVDVANSNHLAAWQCCSYRGSYM